MVESTGDGTVSWCSTVNLFFRQRQLQFKMGSQFQRNDTESSPINAICQKSLISYLPSTLTHQPPEGKKSSTETMKPSD